MAFTLSIAVNPSSVLNPAGLRLAGSVYKPVPASPPTAPPQTPADTGVATPNAFGFGSMLFAGTALPTSDTFTMLVTDAVSGGDIFRSGPVQGIFADSQNLVVLPPPDGLSPIPFSSINTGIAGLLPAPIVVPQWLRVLIFLNTWGATPLLMTITGATLTAPGTPPGLMFTLFGTLSVRYWWQVNNYTFMITVPLTATPSADSSDTSRIIALTTNPGTTNLSIDGLTLSAASLVGLGNLALDNFRPVAEGFLNSFIAATANANLPAGFMLTDTAVISLVSFVILPSGISRPVAVVADLFGQGIVSIPPPLKNLRISMTPAVDKTRALTYVVTVTDGRTPVQGANLNLFSPDGNGITPFMTEITKNDGTAVLTNVTLRPKERFSRFGQFLGEAPWSMTVEADGFNTFAREFI